MNNLINGICLHELESSNKETKLKYLNECLRLFEEKGEYENKLNAKEIHNIW
jgi:hypothetical protein